MVSSGFDHSIAVVIGINSYGNGIAALQSAKADAEAIAHVLKAEYQYEDVILITDDTEVPPTLDGIRHIFERKLPAQINPTEKTRLLVYYAGHGIAEPSNQEPKGYLIPQGATQGDVSTYLSMQDFHQSLCQLNCLHLLVILDCCFGGMFQWAGTRKLVLAEKLYKQHYARFTDHPAWTVISSTAHDQEALDLSLDRRSGGEEALHSPFALALLEGLQQQKADVVRDGIITAHELYAYLQTRIGQLCGDQQNPIISSLKSEYDRGEFIFTNFNFNESKLDDAPPINERNNPYRGLRPFEEQDHEVFFGRDDLIQQLSQRLMQPHSPSHKTLEEDVEEGQDRKNLATAEQRLLVVSGPSGSGKSSLVMAGLLHKLREPSEQNWYILNPMRPGRSPFTALAQVILPLVEDNIISQLESLKFLDQYFSQWLDQQAGEHSADAASQSSQMEAGSCQPNTQHTNAQHLSALAVRWSKAASEARLVLIINHYNQLKDLGSSKEQEQFRHFYQAIQNKLKLVKQNLKQHPQYLADVINAWGPTKPNVNLLLVIDQLEELITMSPVVINHQQPSNAKTQAPGDAQPDWLKFLEALRIALENQPNHLHLVVTLRSDFDNRFKQNTPLQHHWQDACFLVDPMSSEELRQAIEEPARQRAIYFEPPELVDQIIDDVRKMPGALPLLSFTLSELYHALQERWRTEQATDRTLREKDYQDLGEVTGSLTRRAENEYVDLIRIFGKTTGERLQIRMRRILLRMISLEGGGTRRRVPEFELRYPDDQETEDTQIVLDRLVESRLIVTGQELGERYYEPAHDCLVVNWLRQWVRAEEREEIALQRLLMPAAREWQQLIEQWQENHSTSWIDSLSSKLWQFINHYYDQWELHPVSQDQSQTVEQVRDPKQNNPQHFLWHTNPRLKLLRKILHCNSWFNQQEFQFVQASILRKRKNLVRNSLWASIFLLSLLGGVAMTSEYHSFLREIEVLNLQAKNQFLVNRDQLDALLTSLQAQKSSRNYFANQLNGIASFLHLAPQKDLAQLKPEIQRELSKALYSVNESNRLEGHQYDVFAAQFTPDGQYLITGGYDQKLRLWRAKGELLSPIDANPNTTEQLPNPSVPNHSDGGHQAVIRAIAVSADGQRVASSDGAGFVYLWQVQNDQLIYRNHFQANRQNDQGGIASIVRNLAFDPQDSNRLVTVGYDQMMKLWDLSQISHPVSEVHETPEPVIAVKSHPNGNTATKVQDASFSPDGKLLATVGNNHRIRIYKVERLLEEGPSQQSFFECSYPHKKEESVRVFSVQFNPKNPQQFLTAASDKTARLWNLEMGTAGQATACQTNIAFKGHQEEVNSARFNSDGTQIVTTGDDGTARLWNLKGEPLNVWAAHQGMVHSASFSPDGTVIVTAGKDGVIHLWKQPQYPQQIKTGFQSVQSRSVQFNPTRHQELAIAGTDGTIELWTQQDHIWKSPPLSCKGHKGTVFDLSYSSDSRWLATGAEDGKVWLWDIQSQCQQKWLLISYAGDQNHINSVQFSPKNPHLLAAAVEDGTVRLWNLEENVARRSTQLQLNETLSFAAHPNHEALRVAFSPDGQRLVTTGNDGAVRIWQVSSLQEKLQRLNKDLDASQINAIPFETIKSAALLQTCTGHQDWVQGVSFSPQDSNILTTSDSGGTVLIWNLKESSQGKCPKHLDQPIQGYPGNVYGLTFSPDGQTLAVGDQDGTVRLWDLKGNLIAELSGHDRQVFSVAFSPNGKTLAVTDFSTVVRLWPIWQPDKLRVEGCNWARDYLYANQNTKELRDICNDVPPTSF